MLLECNPEIKVVGTAPDGHTGVELVLRLRPEVVIMDIEMPLLNGIEAARQLRAAGFAGGIAMLSSHDERRFVAQAVDAGVDAYVPKQNAFDEVRDAVDSAGRREFFLSPSLVGLLEAGGISGVSDLLTAREREVLQLLAEGHNVKEIAFRFSLSPKTIEAHRANLMAKLKVDNLAELTRRAHSPRPPRRCRQKLTFNSLLQSLGLSACSAAFRIGTAAPATVSAPGIKRSVLKVPRAGKHHRHTSRVRRRDDLGVAHRSTRLDRTRGSCFGGGD